MNKKALITGVTGQDGAYLSELLLGKGYEVHGIKRRSSSLNTERIDHIYENKRFKLHYGDLTDSTNIMRIVKEVKSDEIFNLGAMPHVKVCFDMPEYTTDVNDLGTLRILEVVRLLGLENKTRIYQASTSELYGLVQEIPQTEKTPFYPRSPYAVAKIYAYWITVNYRKAYNIFACKGISFNHESPLRDKTFVTRKITMSVAKIILGVESKLTLGNLYAKRDWGHAKDYVELMWRILQYDIADDWVISTRTTTTVRDFVKHSFRFVGIELEFKGEGMNEIGFVSKIDQDTLNNLSLCSNSIKVGQDLIFVSPNYFRPTEVEILVGDSSKAKSLLNWRPPYDLQLLCEEMVKSDILLLQRKLNCNSNR